MDLNVHNLCNTKLDLVANPIRKSLLLRKREADISHIIDSHNHCVHNTEPNNQSVLIKGNCFEPGNQSVLIKGNKTDSVANLIRKSLGLQI